MPDSLRPLSAARINTYSQAGEDGVLAEIFDRLDIAQGSFCEFGAWDGQHLSNTYAFYNKGWNGVYIEGDETRFADLERNITRPGTDNFCAWVRTEGPTSLDALLAKSHVAKTGVLDLLSIDIDSDDLAIWKSLKSIRPKVVIIEINPTIPIDVYFENIYGQFLGNSARSTYEFARSQDYGLIATTACNMIFIDLRLVHQPLPILDLTDPSLTFGMRMFFGFDGSLIFKGANDQVAQHVIPEIIRLPWNGTRFAQPVAKSFRSGTQSKSRRKLWQAFSRVRLTLMHPIAVLTGKVHKF
ncbi:MAG: hypothetical protein ACOH12_01180 [Parvibaculaceae bacterium]